MRELNSLLFGCMHCVQVFLPGKLPPTQPVPSSESQDVALREKERQRERRKKVVQGDLFLASSLSLSPFGLFYFFPVNVCCICVYKNI